jgi:hypothetical protein
LKSGEELIKTHRPVLYFENDLRFGSPALLGYVLDLGYDLYWHAAPIFSAANFFGNPLNHWKPTNIVSLMVLGIPKERHVDVPELMRIQSPNDWWSQR